jgi:hypothetical protein
MSIESFQLHLSSSCADAYNNGLHPIVSFIYQLLKYQASFIFTYQLKISVAPTLFIILTPVIIF